jgi:hypothetical protein
MWMWCGWLTSADGKRCRRRAPYATVGKDAAEARWLALRGGDPTTATSPEEPPPTEGLSRGGLDRDEIALGRCRQAEQTTVRQAPHSKEKSAGRTTTTAAAQTPKTGR